jgi:hypothetical protein
MLKKKLYSLVLTIGVAISLSAFAGEDGPRNNGVVSSKASGGATILYDEITRDSTGQFSYVFLNKDGKTCSEQDWIDENSDYEITSQNDNSVGCTALKIAQRIKEKLGSCTGKTVQGSEKTQLLALSGPNGIVYYGNPEAHVPQECLCATLTPIYSNVGPGMFNIFKDLGDGEYYDYSISVEAASAQQCASLFDTEQQKAAVFDAYKEFGLQSE